MEQPQFESLAQTLSPILQALEEKRKVLKAQGSKEGIQVGLFFFAIGMLVLAFVGFSAIGIGIISIVSVAIYFGSISRQSKVLSVYYKNDVIARVIQAFCENATFSPDQGISENVFSTCGLFTNPDRYHTEDLIQGQIEKTDFVCAEVHAEEKRMRADSKGRVQYYWEDIFKGFLFIADFHKDFQGKTTIRRDSLFKIKLDESRVKMENPDFEKKFDVYSTDQVEARYLITPSMMERLVELDRKFSNGITLSFRNSTVLIAIPDARNHFEASIWNSLTDVHRLKSEFGTIHSLIQIVNDLNLNTRIWTKE